MLIKIESPVSLNISHLTDLKKLGTFMEDNNLKPNKSEIARQIGIDRRTVSKYMDGFERTSTAINHPNWMHIMIRFTHCFPRRHRFSIIEAYCTTFFATIMV